MMEGSRRAKIMGLSHSTSATHEEVEKYAEICRKDGRRMLWLIAAAFDSTAREINEAEQELVVAKSMGHEDRTIKARERLNRLEEDFRFIHAVKDIINEKLIGDEFDCVYNALLSFLGKKPKKK